MNQPAESSAENESNESWAPRDAAAVYLAGQSGGEVMGSPMRRRPLRCWLADRLGLVVLHRWRRVRQHGVWVYEECAACGRRRAWLYLDGHSPLDFEWLTRSR